MDTISQSEISVQDATNEVGAFLLKYAPSAASGIGNFLNLTRGYHTAQLFCHLNSGTISALNATGSWKFLYTIIKEIWYSTDKSPKIHEKNGWAVRGRRV